MADDDDFEPRLGRMRSGGGKRAQRYIGRVLAAAHLAAGGRALAGSRKAFSGARMGRGAGIGRLLTTRPGGTRRVIVKSRIVRLAGKGADAAAAHLRYLRRDGTTRDGERGRLYGRDDDLVEARDFQARGAGDRHQFRFIVSPEDGDQYDDLRPLTRRLMERLEEDLGTRLDWVAVDHFNTGYPHTHIVLRGVDDHGKDLVIARDYLTRGIRERASAIVDMDLGPVTPHEIAARQRRDIEAERLTLIDRKLLRDQESGVVSMASRDPVEQAMRAGRLARLSRMGLAEPLGHGQYRLADDLENTLRRMGERGDIIRTMQRVVSDKQLDRAAIDQLAHDPGQPRTAPLVGRVVARGLSDEIADRHYLVVDGVDGRAHYVEIGRGADTAPIADGAIVSIAPRKVTVREADRTIAAVAAAHHGRYDVDRHLAHDPQASDDFAEAHVRRLEALRRGGVAVERSAEGGWTIPADYIEQVERLEMRRLADRPVEVEILSSRPVEQLVSADGVTWLDRELATEEPIPLRDAGFGSDARRALEQRRLWLVEQQLGEGGSEDFRMQRGAVAALQRRELWRAGATLSGDVGQPFAETAAGDRIEGIYRRPVELVSGRFALIERSHDFVLVPWRPALERAVNKSVSGVIREHGTSWTIGRGRGGPSIS